MRERVRYERLRQWLQNWAKTARATFRLMVGVPDYDVYVRHRRLHHPDDAVMTFEEFFRERQKTRYDSGRIGRCC